MCRSAFCTESRVFTCLFSVFSNNKCSRRRHPACTLYPPFIDLFSPIATCLALRACCRRRLPHSCWRPSLLHPSTTKPTSSTSKPTRSMMSWLVCTRSTLAEGTCIGPRAPATVTRPTATSHRHHPCRRTHRPLLAARQQRLGEQPLPDKASSLRAAAALLQARNESRWNTILPPTQDASTTAAERFQAFQQKRQRAKAARERAKAEAARHAAIEEPAPLEAQARSAGVVVKSPELKLSQPLEGLRSPATLGALKPRPPSRGELGSPSRPQSRGARPKSREKGVLSGVLGEVIRPGSRAAPPGAADLLGRCSPIPLPSKPPARVLPAIKREP